MSTPPQTPGKPALELCEEAVFLLRRASPGAWSLYFLGAGPFLLALLYFWTDMTRGTVDAARVGGGAMVLSILFIWMKTCHALFASRLWSLLSGVSRPRTTARQWLKIAASQTCLQTWGLALLPAAALLTVPFGWVYAYYQNLTALGAAPLEPGESLHALALAQSRLWPKQNHGGLMALTALGFVIFLDLLILLLLIPQLLTTFLGVKEMIQPNIWLALNTTFLALVASLTYLVVDPLMKAFYILRCFYGQSRVTGEDLRARLALARLARSPRDPASRAAKVAALLFLACAGLKAAEPDAAGRQTNAIVSASRAKAQPADVATPGKLDASIAETLKSSEYNWRFEREVEETKSSSFWKTFFQPIGDAIQTALDWVAEWLKKKESKEPKESADSGGFWSWVSAKLILAAFLIVAAIIMLALFVQRRRRPATSNTMAAPTTVVPDLSDENVAPDQLPDDEWLRMASTLAGQGELRLAIRALFLSALSNMASRRWITVALFKSNRDYEKEFTRRAAAIPGAIAAFGRLVAIYNRVWYGLHEPTPDLFVECQESVRVLRI